MGGDEWSHTGPYRQDPAAAFRQAQDEELARHDHGFAGRGIAEPWHDPRWCEYVFTGDTGTVLDFPEMIEATEPDRAPHPRPLTDAEVRAWAPHGRPTHAEWDHALDTGQLAFPGRAQGNCTVLYRDGLPVEIGYWGVTAD
ncbi:hypothetical protein ACFV2D_13120 [Streptomyces capillispiralis]|uniref:hypothetical protein n=1 Tax=Streptomyces capillispiralis TaxID=68182 RepID=UPI0036B3F77A